MGDKDGAAKLFLPMGPEEKFRLYLDHFCEAMDDFLDPEGSTSAEELIKRWFEFRAVRAELAVEALKEFVLSHPQYGGSQVVVN